MQANSFKPELLFQVLQNYKTALQRGFKSHQLALSALDAKILKLIAHQGINTPQMLAQYSGRDKAQVTRLLSDMEQRGLIEKVPHPTDKRSVCLVLSADALELIAHIRQIDAAISSQMLAGLDQAQQQTLSLLLQKIADNLQ
ncbi:MarR family winged helix-turn-helix transcriptional regulator [Rheinheimera texasensis]|uniref:MarR family winged helix-turn-helix transcriptional regulator n=1 Tax=Rheinheimera texasensis TaxID=306205 RepID=UPI0004E1210E|nr:MarR family transcriptional regulator [Rheinheimera texasensis]